MLLPLTVCSVCLIIPTPIATILCGIFLIPLLRLPRAVILIPLLRMPLATMGCGTSLIPLPIVLPLAVTVCEPLWFWFWSFCQCEECLWFHCWSFCLSRLLDAESLWVRVSFVSWSWSCSFCQSGSLLFHLSQRSSVFCQSGSLCFHLSQRSSAFCQSGSLCFHLSQRSSVFCQSGSLCFHLSQRSSCSSFSWWESFRVSVEFAWFQGWSIDHWESLSLSAASAVSYRLSFSDSACHSYASWLRSSARGTSLIVKREIIWKDNKNRAWPDLGSELPSASPIYWLYRGAQLPAKCQHFK